MSTGKILAGLLAGAAAGAALGLLLAPDKTSDVIKKVSGTVKKSVSKKDDYIEGIKEKVVDFLFILIDTLSAEKQKTEPADAG